jgi:hypothetical protein
LHQQKFIEKDFENAALFFLASAKQGHSENQNYLSFSN